MPQTDLLKRPTENITPYQMTSNDFVKIFYSNFTPSIDWANIDEIAWMYQEGLFSLNKILLASNSDYLEKINLIEKNRYKKVWESGDSIPHQALKMTGANYLQQTFQLKPADIYYEHPFVGFEVDVIDKTLAHPVECGDTNPLKLEYYLIAEEVQNMFILPYPHQKDVYAYSFTSNGDFKKYVLFKRDYLRKKLRVK